RFLCELCERLSNVHRVAEAIQLIILLEDESTYERLFRIPAPTTEVDVLFRILHTHLDTLQLPHRLTGIRLNIESTLPLKEQLHLFEGALRDPNRFGETLAKLKAILGDNCVGIPTKLDTHQPGRFVLNHTFDSHPNQPKETTPPPIGLPL